MCYSSNISTAQFELIRKFLPQVKQTRPRIYTQHELINGMMYVLVNGCKWRDLPSDMPKWSSVYQYYRKLVFSKYLDDIMYKLNYKIHKVVGSRINNTHNFKPLYILITDSQSVRCMNLTKKEDKGYDGNKKVDGLKRFILIDVLGCVWYSKCVYGNLSEKTEIAKIMKSFTSMKACPKQFKSLLADKGFESENLKQTLSKESGVTLYAMRSTERLKKQTKYDNQQIEHIRKENSLIKKFRWIVEQGFCFLDKARRLIVNHERKTKMHEGFVKLQFIRLKLNQLVG